MKIALCFIINYEHLLSKEHIWREWIEPNKDIINVYFYYNDLTKIKSQWIMEHTIPPVCICETSYFFVVPAYLSLLNFAYAHDTLNTWFCMLTETCCPIISPKRFRYLFFKYFNNSIFSWKTAWWNPSFHKRGNLAKLPKELWLANDPWFTLTRENVKQILYFINNETKITQTICSGGLANETLFAVIFYFSGDIKREQITDKKDKTHTEDKNEKNEKKESVNNNRIISYPTHIVDWARTNSPTSPHIFKDADNLDIKVIENELKQNDYVMFIRKVSPKFPDYTLRYYIYDYNKLNDDKLIINEYYKKNLLFYDNINNLIKKIYFFGTLYVKELCLAFIFMLFIKVYIF